MKYRLLILIFLAANTLALAQKNVLDSLKTVLANTKTDTGRAHVLSKIADIYAIDHPDSELFTAQQVLFISHHTSYLNGEIWSLIQMAEAYHTMGNYPLALSYYFQRLKLDEKYPDPERQMTTLFNIAGLYQNEGDYNRALMYANKAGALTDKYHLDRDRWYIYTNLGDLYEKINNIPKAFYYNRKAYDLALKANNGSWKGVGLNNIGNSYLKAKKNAQALNSYKMAIPYLLKDNNTSCLCDSYNGISSVLNQAGKLDSAAWYAKQALSLSHNRDLSNHYLQACQLLTDIYRKAKGADSALAYMGRMQVMKDSIYSQEKVRQIENLTIAESLRQKEREDERLQEDKERSYKLKMLMIGLSIPLFFLVSVILSKRKIKPRIVEFAGIISLLLLFEYLTLLLHPMISDFTGHSPFLEIFIFVALAAILTPSHHRLENWMLHRLTHKHAGDQPAAAPHQEDTAHYEPAVVKVATPKKPRAKPVKKQRP